MCNWNPTVLMDITSDLCIAVNTLNIMNLKVKSQKLEMMLSILVPLQR